MGLAAPLNDRDPARPLGAASARHASNEEAFGSLISLGPRKLKKKPVLVLAAEELEEAHRQFDLDGAHIMGEDASPDVSPLSEAPEPTPRPAITLGLAPIDSDDPELGEDEFDESDLPPLPDTFTDPDILLGLGEEDAQEEEPAQPARKRVGIDMVALRLAANMADPEDEYGDEAAAETMPETMPETAEDAAPSPTFEATTASDEPLEAQSDEAPEDLPLEELAHENLFEEPEPAIVEQELPAPAPLADRKTTIEAASESWDLPFLTQPKNPEPAAEEVDEPTVPAPAEDTPVAEEQDPAHEVTSEHEAEPEPEAEWVPEPQAAPEAEPEPEPEDELLLSEPYETWDPNFLPEPETITISAMQANPSHIRARLIHEDAELEEGFSSDISLFTRLWRWLAARF